MAATRRCLGQVANTFQPSWARAGVTQPTLDASYYGYRPDSKCDFAVCQGRVTHFKNFCQGELLGKISVGRLSLNS